MKLSARDIQQEINLHFQIENDLENDYLDREHRVSNPEEWEYELDEPDYHDDYDYDDSWRDDHWVNDGPYFSDDDWC